MRLYHQNYIIPGLVAFLVIITFPMWSSIVTKKPNFDNPIAAAEGEACVESAAFMRTNHMQMLNQWRDEVVREGNRVYRAGNGREWRKSLTGTCMECHGKAERVEGQWKSTSAATYCIECHNYVGISNYCWDCHVDPVEVGQAVKEAR